MKKLLSIDGGGIRGIVPLMLLDVLLKKTQKILPEAFDVVAGTSTGAIIALGLLTPDRKKQPLYTPKDLLNMYLENAQKIFSSSFWRKVRTAWGFWGADYDSNSLKNVLEMYFGKQRLSEVLLPVIIPTYSVKENKVTFWSSEIAKQGPSKDFHLVDIALAASAAPTYFEPHKFTNIDQSKEFIEVDGGLYANNPSMIGLSQTSHIYSNHAVRDYDVLSLGTGTPKPHIKDLKDSLGVYEWVFHQNLIDIMMNSDNEETLYVVKQIMGKNFQRLQVPLKQDVTMDETDPKKLQGLLEEVKLYIEENKNTLESISKKITSS
ncbi:MAG: hypothetical protein CMM87_06210 [Rickettsiales bacterium]|nr:hypothetical protein [Rickettsiales bacterium]|tara:strand:+ start:9204 stop:10163 length:960 start_codon:yes stop_codon:yes gene_type:complete